MKEKIVHKTLKQMKYEWKDQLVNELYGENFYLIEEFNKQKEVLDKIKEWVYHQQQSNENLEPYISTDKLDYILELLEEIE